MSVVLDENIPIIRRTLWKDPNRNPYNSLHVQIQTKYTVVPSVKTVILFVLYANQLIYS